MLGLSLVMSLVLAACDEPPPGRPPEAKLRAPSSCDLGDSMVLDAGSSSDPDGDIVLYRFVIADGTAARQETQPRIEHVCRVAGLIETAVQVVDAEGNSSWARAVVSVRRP